MKHIRLSLALVAGLGLAAPAFAGTTTSTTTGACPTSQFVNVVGAQATNLACAQPQMGDLSGTLPVASGGTGAATLTSHGVLVGAGTSAVSGLTAATTGQYLIGVTSANPTWAAPASATTTPANPSAVSPGTSTAQMLGLAAGTGPSTLTPASTGRVYYTFTFTVLIASTSNGATFQCSHGTGTAPANAASVTGTQDATAVAYLAGATTAKAVITCSAVVTGLTLATPVWFDVAVLNTTGSQAVTASVPQFSAFEF